MNIFIIPSWYPSPDHPISGIFNKEQAVALSKYDPSSNFAISLWGQKTEGNLLWGKDHFLNLLKIFKFLSLFAWEKEVSNNLIEYYSPALTWTKKILAGNMSNIIKANVENFKRFENKVGKVDMIHAHATYPAGYVALILSREFKIPYIITEQITPFPSKHYLDSRGKLARDVSRTLVEAQSIVAVSPALHAKFLEMGFLKSICIPNLTDEFFFKPSRNNSPSNVITFFMLGRMVEQKGVNILLQALADCGNRNIYFRIGGDGKKLDEYKKIATQLNLTNITWLGKLNRNEVRDELQRCQAFVLPSLHENLPLVLLEAIACGKPIIATKCGGPESIVNENNGLLAEVGDNQDLANKIGWMVENYHTYNADQIREDFMKRFSRPVVCGQIIDLYKKVIDEQLLHD